MNAGGGGGGLAITEEADIELAQNSNQRMVLDICTPRREQFAKLPELARCHNVRLPPKADVTCPMQ